MTKVCVLVGALAVPWLVGFAVGCGLVSDQTKQEAKKKVEAKGICQVTILFFARLLLLGPNFGELRIGEVLRMRLLGTWTKLFRR